MRTFTSRIGLAFVLALAGVIAVRASDVYSGALLAMGLLFVAFGAVAFMKDVGKRDGTIPEARDFSYVGGEGYPHTGGGHSHSEGDGHSDGACDFGAGGGDAGASCN